MNSTFSATWRFSLGCVPSNTRPIPPWPSVFSSVKPGISSRTCRTTSAAFMPDRLELGNLEGARLHRAGALLRLLLVFHRRLVHDELVAPGFLGHVQRAVRELDEVGARRR